MRLQQIPASALAMSVLFLTPLGLTFVQTAFAQDNSPTRALGTPQDTANLPIQKIGPQDLIAVQVYDSPEFSRTIRVLDNGEIRLHPMIKQMLKVEGLYPDQIAMLIQDQLKKEHLLVDPYVTVTVAEYHSKPISVTGAVKLPTIFQAIGPVSLLDALAKAGGPADNAGGELIVTRPNGPSGNSVQRINIKMLQNGTDASLNLKLQGGDMVSVPTVGTVVVAGNVHLSGIYPVQDTGTTTVLTAIAQAQGVGDYKPSKVFIYRPDDQGVKHEIEVDLTDILKRKKPDVTLQARDVLYVPDNNGKKNFNLWMDRISGVGTGAATGALIYRSAPTK